MVIANFESQLLLWFFYLQDRGERSLSQGRFTNNQFWPNEESPDSVQAQISTAI